MASTLLPLRSILLGRGLLPFAHRRQSYGPDALHPSQVRPTNGSSKWLPFLFFGGRGALKIRAFFESSQLKREFVHGGSGCCELLTRGCRECAALGARMYALRVWDCD
jgi:hypothetical protein